MQKITRLMTAFLIAAAALAAAAVFVPMEDAEASGPSKNAYIMVGSFKKGSYLDPDKSNYLWNAWDGKKSAYKNNILSYDKNTNTLTLKNFNSPKVVIGCYQMGTSFKVRVRGSKNSIQALVVDNGDSKSKKAGNLTLYGTGRLAINKNKKSTLVPLNLVAEGKAAKMNMKKGLKLTVYVKDAKLPTVQVSNSATKKCLVIGGKYNYKIKREKVSGRYYCYTTAPTVFKKTS